jgi:hypothetical protein
MRSPVYLSSKSMVAAPRGAMVTCFVSVRGAS